MYNWILLFIIIISIAYVVYARIIRDNVNFVNVINGASTFFGGRENELKTGSYGESLENQIYYLLMDYVTEVGTDEHIVKYLQILHNIDEQIKPDYIVENDSSIRYKKLYSVIKRVIEKTHPRDKHDFVFYNNIRFVWFLPENWREPLLNTDKYNIQLLDVYAIKRMLEYFLDPLNTPKNVSTIKLETIEDLARDLLPVTRDYIKYKVSILRDLNTKQNAVTNVHGAEEANILELMDTVIEPELQKLDTSAKKKTTTKKKTDKSERIMDKSERIVGKSEPADLQNNKSEEKESHSYKAPVISKQNIEPDLIAFNALLARITRATAEYTKMIKERENKPRLVDLREINLMDLYWQDPISVRMFLNRISPTIEHIIKLESKQNQYIRNPITSLADDLSREMSDKLKYKNMVQNHLLDRELALLNERSKYTYVNGVTDDLHNYGQIESNYGQIESNYGQIENDLPDDY